MLRTLAGGYGFIFTHLANLIGYLILPALLCALGALFVIRTEIGQIALFNAYIGSGRLEPSAFQTYAIFAGRSWLTMPAGILVMAAQLAVFTMFAVAWQRRSLIGSQSGPLRGVFRWRMRHWRFFAFAVVIVGAALIANRLIAAGFAVIMQSAVLPYYPIDTLSATVGVNMLSWTLIGLVAARMLLVFPDAALDRRRINLPVAVEISRGNSARMLLVLVCGALLPLALALAVSNQLLFGHLLAPTLHQAGLLLFLGLLVRYMMLMAAVAVGLACLSVIYRQYVDYEKAQRPVYANDLSAPAPPVTAPGAGAGIPEYSRRTGKPAPAAGQPRRRVNQA